MLFLLISLIKSVIYDYTIPRLFETIEDYSVYDPILYNYDFIHKDFNIYKCLNTDHFRENECIKYSIKKFYDPFSLIKTNNPQKDNKESKGLNQDKKSEKFREIRRERYQKFWLECGKQGINICIDLYNTFKIFNMDDTTENLTFDTKNQKEFTIFNRLRESHDIMYQIGEYKVKNNTKIESEIERKLRFQKVYNILKPIAFLAFEKYIKDNFGSLRPIKRFDHNFVEDLLNCRTAYFDELKILTEGKHLQKDPSWMFDDIIYPEAAKLLYDIVTRRKEGPETPLNKIYELLLKLRFPYLFEKGFDSKKRFQMIYENNEETNENKNKEIQNENENNEDKNEDIQNEDDKKTNKDDDNEETNENKEIQDENENNAVSNEDKNKGIQNENLNNEETNKDESNEETNENKEIQDENENNAETKEDKNKGIQNENLNNEETNEDEGNEENNEDENNYFDYYNEDEYDEFNEYDEEEYYEEDKFNIFYDFYIENEFKDISYIIKKRPFFYDYNINDDDNENNPEIQKKKYVINKKSAKTDQSDLYSNLFKYIESNYHDTAISHIDEIEEICKEYLISLKDIEIINQSNLTKKIATIYGIDTLFYPYSKQFLRKASVFDVYDNDENLVSCKFFDDSLFYLTMAAKNGEVKAAEALIFKFLIMAKETNDNKTLDEYFDYFLNEFSQFYDENANKSFPPNIYVHFHDLFKPLVADFFDSIIFFNDTYRNYFQVDQITDFNRTFTSSVEEELNSNYYHYKNPRNWTYEDAAKALRRFIDSSFLVQSGHLAEMALSCSSGFLVFLQNSGRILNYLSIAAAFFGNFYAMFTNPFVNSDSYDENEITLNWRKVNKRTFNYALRVYQTLALSGNRDAMWNAQILMKAADIENQHFTQFITDSNETFFLHDLDIPHQKTKVVNKTDEAAELINEKQNLEEMRSIRYFIRHYFSLLYSYVYEFISLSPFYIPEKFLIKDEEDIPFYEEISDKDPYAAFALAWKKRDNLTESIRLLDLTEKLKPDSKLAVITSKVTIKTLSFFNGLFNKKKEAKTNLSLNVSYTIALKRIFDPQIIKSYPRLFDILIGIGILIVLSFLIYIRIFLYCN